MIYSFSVENFYSIGERVEVDLLSREKKPNAIEMYLDTVFGDKVTKIAFIGGTNAGGKTNLLRALPYLKYLIVDSIMDINGDNMRLSQFAPYDGTKTTKLSVSFSIDNEIFYYDIELSANKIIFESLKRKRMNEKRASFSDIFYRKWVNNAGRYECKIHDELKNIKSLTTMQELIDSKKCASFIAILSNFDENNGILRRIIEYWNGVVSNVQMFGNTETNNSMASLSAQSLKNIYEDRELYNKVLSVLKKYDIGFNDIIKKEKQGVNKDRTVYVIEHKYDKSKICLPMNYESSGTQKMIILLETIMTALSKKEGVAVVDELDAFLHPDIFEAIIGLFISSNTNSNNSQLIFSSQNYSILTVLDKQQIMLAEKDNNSGQTEVWRLDDTDGINSRDDFYKKYLTGAYGAVPNIG